MLIKILLLSAALGFCIPASIGFCHMFQLESYKPREYNNWVADKGSGQVFYIVLMSLVYFLMGTFILVLNPVVRIAGIVLLLLFIGMGVYYFIKFRIRNGKTPLKYTWRIRRLIITLCILFLIMAVISLLVSVSIMGVFMLILPFTIVIANLINTPIEEGIKKKYFNEAKDKIAARDDLIKIGITGSYGKTSTKFILGTILSEKYDVLVPPSSYNTPMGLTRVIREQLTDAHQVFLAEMGAKNIGDIEELVGLVHPKYGIITSVGPQHLESFGTIENVAATKYELIEGLPKDGVAFFPDDHGITREMYERTELKKVLFSTDGDADVRAENIRLTKDGCEFDVVTASGRFPVKTELLGVHNVQNILGCIAIAIELGLSEEEIERGVKKIKPVEHRLQLIKGGGGVTVIDDAFNSNPAGSRMAIDVIASFDGRKIVVTPGMIELGEIEEEENGKFGRYMADKVDFVYLVGPKQTVPIHNGLLEGGFPEENIKVVNSLNDASEAMKTMLRPGDIVLFENDLPDNYNEG